MVNFKNGFQRKAICLKVPSLPSVFIKNAASPDSGYGSRAFSETSPADPLSPNGATGLSEHHPLFRETIRNFRQ
ncbi:hypothetical protein TNCT_296781 [Trichonephila clavata]|uniref:Uncharacterized protein n=1 Tax=Trichonephila clavata TaxID=2740835 RepID=A0A8X6JN94_TRICU|nr:hypothetical protein TNCT_296781 [Trichonephila clavata]